MKIWTFKSGLGISIFGYTWLIRNFKKAPLIFSERLVRDKKLALPQWIIGKFIIKKTKTHIWND